MYKLYWFLFAALVIFSSYILFYKLGTEPFQDYDEATYAEVTYESLERGNPTPLSFLNQPYFRKPPMLFWLTTASTQVFPDTEFALRFPSALAGLLTILLVVLICYEAGAGLGVALFAGAILATTSTWMEFARDVRFDNLVTLFIVAAFYAGMRAQRDRRWYVLVGMLLAFAVLSKSVIAVFGGVALLAYVLLMQGWARTAALLKDRQVWLGIGAFLLVAAPWHIYMSLMYGIAFWHSYLGTEVLERASSNLFPNSNNPTSSEYAVYILGYAAPWAELFVLLLAALPWVFRKMKPSVRSTLGASVVTVLAVLIVMFTAQTKAFGYLMPMYPFAAIALGLAAGEVWRALQRASFGKRFPFGTSDRVVRALAYTLALGVLVILLFYAARLTRFNSFHINPYYGWEIGQAYEERDVAAIIRAADNPTVYAYGYDAIGTILYYSRLPDSAHPYVNTWNAERSLSGTTLLLATTSLVALTEEFPAFEFTQLYSGKFVSLFTVTD